MAIPNASIFTTSLEQVAVSVTPPIGINPTSDVVQFAFLSNLPPIQPTVGQYVNGSWQGTIQPYVALCLVGPGGGTALAQGQYNVWLKITASPETPVKWCGILQVS